MSLHLLAQLGVLHHGVLLVELEAADPVEALEVEPASPPDANAVQDHRGFQMQLQTFFQALALNINIILLLSVASGKRLLSRQRVSLCQYLPKAGEYFVRTALRAHLHLSAGRRNFPNGEIIGQSY